MDDRKSILCFGDSLTWGQIPAAPGEPSRRYAPEKRWTGVLATELGPGFHVVEEGLSGRTTCVDDPLDPRLNGAAHLPAILASHLPLDLVVLMLGTNDTKAYFARTPRDIALGIAVLLGQIAGSARAVWTDYPAPRALVVAPPRLGRVPQGWGRELLDGAGEKIWQLPALYQSLTEASGAAFLDAGRAADSIGVDGVHLTEESNRALGLAMARAVRAALS